MRWRFCSPVRYSLKVKAGAVAEEEVMEAIAAAVTRDTAAIAVTGAEATSDRGMAVVIVAIAEAVAMTDAVGEIRGAGSVTFDKNSARWVEAVGNASTTLNANSLSNGGTRSAGKLSSGSTPGVGKMTAVDITCSGASGSEYSASSVSINRNRTGDGFAASRISIGSITEML